MHASFFKRLPNQKFLFWSHFKNFSLVDGLIFKFVQFKKKSITEILILNDQWSHNQVLNFQPNTELPLQKAIYKLRNPVNWSTTWAYLSSLYGNSVLFWARWCNILLFEMTNWADRVFYKIIFCHSNILLFLYRSQENYNYCGTMGFSWQKP